MHRRQAQTAVRVGTTTAIGVVVTLGAWIGPAHAQDRALDAVTYAEHIAPILNGNCVVCHRLGAIGPFPLMTFAEVEPRARQIAEVVQSGAMPPWKPEPGVERLQGERRLSADEVELIRRWVGAGAPEGDPGEAPESPVWPDGWHAGSPDLVVTMPDPFTLPAGGEDVYRNFVVRIPLTARQFVTAVELKPYTTQGIHHARVMIDRTGTARQRDDADPVTGYDDSEIDGARFPDGHFIGWAPGTLASGVPGELAWPLEPGTDLVLKTHLVPRDVPVDLQVSVGFFFADTPPAMTPVVVQLGSQTIDLPAGDPAHVVEDTYQLPVAVDLLAIYPHAHFLLREVEASALLPDGTTRPLLRIDDWDFDWQDEYRYAEQVRLPEGTTIRMRYVFDNSAGNPNNPSRPPSRVRFGPRSTDEMAELTLQVLPVDPSDRLTLAEDVGRKVSHIILAGSEKKLTDDATSANHENYAVSLVAVGRIDEAVEQLEGALRLDPNRATAHYRLGTALMIQGSRDDAADHFRRAIDLDTSFPEAHNSLGALFHLAGNVVEAERHYRRTLQLDPAHAGAHRNLGNILLGAERFGEAESEFRDALALRPESADAYIGLGQALAGQGKRGEAQAAFDRARALESARP